MKRFVRLLALSVLVAACSRSSSNRPAPAASASAAVDPASTTLVLDKPAHGVQIGTPEFTVPS
ncbi:MAG: hypothetical protein ABI551_20990, partial [Polyangiaceae bacterium]